MTDRFHNPVLAEEAIEFLLTKLDGIYVDANIGGGGHSEKILNKIYPSGTLIGIDADHDAVSYTRKLFGEKVLITQGNFSDLSRLLSQRGINKIDGILFDLGVSSYQLESVQRGFGFMNEAKLDMRFDKNQELDAYKVINCYSEEQLNHIFLKYGEEKYSRQIARKIFSSRLLNPIVTTKDLVNLIKSTVKTKFINKTLARIFQAIRIEVNNELVALECALNEAIKILNPGGRIVIISYHSLEDRIVKEFMKRNSLKKIYSGHKLIPDIETVPSLKVLTKKPITPKSAEIERNPRGRSAKLRAAEKI